MNLAKNRAFTIIEAIAAIVIATAVSIAIFASLMTSFSYIRRIGELRTASLALQEEISLIRELKFTSIQSLGATFQTTSMSTLTDAVGRITKSQYGGQANILKLTLKLEWTAFDGTSAGKSIVTLVTDHGIDKQ